MTHGDGGGGGGGGGGHHGGDGGGFGGHHHGGGSGGGQHDGPGAAPNDPPAYGPWGYAPNGPPQGVYGRAPGYAPNVDAYGRPVQPYPPYGPYGGWPGAAPGPSTNGLAIGSLVCSIAGLFFFGVTALVGIILGAVSLSQIARSEGRQQGRGLAIAGIIVGVVMVLFYVGIIVIIAVAASHSNNDYDSLVRGVRTTRFAR